MILFRYLAILSWYWLVFYKLQSKVFVLLPADDDVIFTAFKSMIYVLWVCQFVRVRAGVWWKPFLCLVWYCTVMTPAVPICVRRFVKLFTGKRQWTCISSIGKSHAGWYAWWRVSECFVDVWGMHVQFIQLKAVIKLRSTACMISFRCFFCTPARGWGHHHTWRNKVIDAVTIYTFVTVNGGVRRRVQCSIAYTPHKQSNAPVKLRASVRLANCICRKRVVGAAGNSFQPCNRCCFCCNSATYCLRSAQHEQVSFFYAAVLIPRVSFWLMKWLFALWSSSSLLAVVP